MSRAEGVLLASYIILRRLRAEHIEIPTDVLLEFYRRVERWCAEAQIAEGQRPAWTSGKEA